MSEFVDPRWIPKSSASCRWCPEGCGKSVVTILFSVRPVFRCFRCGFETRDVEDCDV